MTPAVTASSKGDEAAGSAEGPLAALLASQCHILCLCKCLQKGLGHLLRMRILPTDFPVGGVAPGKDKELFAWLLFFDLCFQWDVVLGLLGVSAKQPRWVTCRLIQTHDLASLSPHRSAIPRRVLGHFQLRRGSRRCAGSDGLFGQWQSQVPEPSLQRPHRCAALRLPPSTAAGSAGTAGHAGGWWWAWLGTKGRVSSHVWASPLGVGGCTGQSLCLEEDSLEYPIRLSLSPCPFPSRTQWERRPPSWWSLCWVRCARHTWRSSMKVGALGGQRGLGEAVAGDG